MSADSGVAPLLLNPEAQSSNRTSTTFAEVHAHNVDGRSQGAGNDVRNTKSRAYYERSKKNQTGSIKQDNGDHYHTHHHYHGSPEFPDEQSWTQSSPQLESAAESIGAFTSRHNLPLPTRTSLTTPYPIRQSISVSDHLQFEIFNHESYQKEIQKLRSELDKKEASHKQDIQLLEYKLEEEAGKHKKELRAQDLFHRHVSQVLRNKLQLAGSKLSESKKKYAERESKYQAMEKEANNNLYQQLKHLQLKLRTHKAEEELSRRAIIKLREQVKETRNSKEDIKLYFGGQIANLNHLLLKSIQHAHRFRREGILAKIELKVVIRDGLQADIKSLSGDDTSQKHQVYLAECERDKMQQKWTVVTPNEKKQLRVDRETARLRVAKEYEKLEDIREQMRRLRVQEMEVSSDLESLEIELEKIESEDMMGDSLRSSNNSLSPAPDLIPDEGNIIEPEYPSSGTSGQMQELFYNPSHISVASKQRQKHNRSSSYLPLSSPVLWI